MLIILQVLRELTLPLLTNTETTYTEVDCLGASFQKRAEKIRHCKRQIWDYVDKRVKFVSHFNL